MKVSFLFAWYDIWIGFFWDNKKKWLYILPLPCIGVVIKFKSKREKLTPEQLLEMYYKTGLNFFDYQGRNVGGIEVEDK